ncbi:MAG: hypothetical protein IJ728_00665 [Selenomonadaceae bacterium]|nr:hypothetical protein [Selenomonadaceae bacterium]
MVDVLISFDFCVNYITPPPNCQAFDNSTKYVIINRRLPTPRRSEVIDMEDLFLSFVINIGAGLVVNGFFYWLQNHNKK